MTFSKPLRSRVQSGEITCSVRVWKQPRVKVGGRYALPPGEIEVTSIRAMKRGEITQEIAQRSGFDSVPALMAVAQHGSGEAIFLVEFFYDE
jgi:hypothetical protein